MERMEGRGWRGGGGGKGWSEGGERMMAKKGGRRREGEATMGRTLEKLLVG